MNEDLKRIIESTLKEAGNKYFIGLPTVDEAYEGNAGDGLGAFVVIECYERCEGMTDPEEIRFECQCALDVAIDNLKLIRSHI